MFYLFLMLMEPTTLVCKSLYKFRDGHVTMVPKNDLGDSMWEGFRVTPPMTGIGCSICNQAA